MLASRVQVDPISSGSSHILTGQSEKRVSIFFFPPSTGRATLHNETPVVAGSGVIITANMPPLEFHVHRHGDCVQREWYVIYDGTTSPLTWVECLATCEDDQKKQFGQTLYQRGQLYPDMPLMRSGYGA